MRRSLKSFKDIIILLDFNNQVWRSHFATERKMSPNSDGIHTGSILGLVKILMHAINRSKEHNSLPKLVICEDRYPIRKQMLYQKHQKAFKDYDGEIRYKGNRKKKDMDYDPVQICKEFMSCIPHTSVYAEEEEADDVMASFVLENRDNPTIMYSTDRDMWQLLKKYKNLKIFLSGEGQQPDKEMLLKKFQTTLFKKVVLHKIITGDTGDNVKGVMRYQFKRSLPAFKACNGTVEDYVDQLIKIFGNNNKFVMHLFKEHNIKLMSLNTQLVKLKTDIKYTKEVFKTADLDKWKHLCHAFETPSLLNVKLMEIF